MKKLLKIIGNIFAAIMIVLLLLLGQCIYNEVNQQRGLESLCATAKVGGTIDTFLDDTAKTTYKVRTGGSTGKDDNEWFDREYLRIGVWLNKSKKISDDYTVVFAKPGIGYYACIVIHRDALVTSAWFEDRSS
jgi:hypothetical protein